MKRREFFKNVGNVGAFGAGAMALGMMEVDPIQVM